MYILLGVISSLFSVRVIIKLPGKKDMSSSDLGCYTCSTTVWGAQIVPNALFTTKQQQKQGCFLLFLILFAFSTSHRNSGP